MQKTVRQKRLELFKKRVLVAIDLSVAFGLVGVTVLFSFVTAETTSSVGLHLFLSLILNGAMVVFVGYYLLKHAGSW